MADRKESCVSATQNQDTVWPISQEVPHTIKQAANTFSLCLETSMNLNI